MPSPDPIGRRSLLGGALVAGALLAAPSRARPVRSGRVVRAPWPRRADRSRRARAPNRTAAPADARAGHRRAARRAGRIAGLFHRHPMASQRADSPPRSSRSTARSRSSRPSSRRPRSARRSRVPAEVRTWHEDEDPLALIGAALRDRGAATGTIAIEETLRYFIVDGVKTALPNATIVSGAARRARLPHDQVGGRDRADAARDRHHHRRLSPDRSRASDAGMTPDDVSKMMDAATGALGGAPEFSLVLMGEAAAYPHGSRKPPGRARGRDRADGLRLHGRGLSVRRLAHLRARAAQATASAQVWDQVHRGQQIAFAAAQVGAPAGSVDDAVRRYYESLGYGPGYALPGLSHRTGHGIGLDGHEPVNLVHGETTRWRRACASPTSPASIFPASSACGWRTAST